jgi:hypothetical protein
MPAAAVAQQVIHYGPENLTARVNYNYCLGMYSPYYASLPEYPARGAYSPTHYSNSTRNTAPGEIYGVGICNYIYIPTAGELIPGHQYKIRMTLKFGTAYAELPYFQSHFGVALASELPENYWGLWRFHYVPTRCEPTKEPIAVDFVFRPLCTSKYIAVGVFQGPTDDPADCFLCQYGFELYNLSVEIWDDPNASFVYICDAFEEQRLKKKYSDPETDTVFFDSGSHQIRDEYVSLLDSIPSKLRTSQDLITLYAYTDKEGNENVELGAARNAAIYTALIQRGIDTSRIILVNYGESRASDRISRFDRRVEIRFNEGKLFQKYYTSALSAASQGNYGLAKEMIVNWLKKVPQDHAIYALFDCWGEVEKEEMFKKDLVRSIKSAFYRGKDLKFTLDSLYCEDQKGRTLSMYRSINRMPGFRLDCSHSLDTLRNEHNKTIIERIYLEHSFPQIADVGVRGNQTLPYMILHVRDTTFKKQYLPIMQKACEEQLLSWEYYAMLYDKISIARNGHQRYGTQWEADANGVLIGLYPFEDEDMVAEYRKQVALPPLRDY